MAPVMPFANPRGNLRRPACEAARCARRLPASSGPSLVALYRRAILANKRGRAHRFPGTWHYDSGAAAAWPLAARAQQGERLRRIGVVMAYTESDPNGQIQVEAFRQQLKKLGWMEGSNIQSDFRYAAADPSRIRTLAVELVGLKPDLMVSNSNLVTTILQSEVNGSFLARSGTDANPHTLKPMDCRTEPPCPLSDVISSTLDCGLIRRLDDSRSNSTRDSSRANHLARRASGPPRQAPGFSVFRRLRNARGVPRRSPETARRPPISPTALDRLSRAQSNPVECALALFRQTRRYRCQTHVPPLGRCKASADMAHRDRTAWLRMQSDAKRSRGANLPAICDLQGEFQKSQGSANSMLPSFLIGPSS
jgi:hypothetical protein